jgi:hypothetical protein
VRERERERERGDFLAAASEDAAVWDVIPCSLQSFCFRWRVFGRIFEKKI